MGCVFSRLPKASERVRGAHEKTENAMRSPKRQNKTSLGFPFRMGGAFGYLALRLSCSKKGATKLRAIGSSLVVQNSSLAPMPAESSSGLHMPKP